MTSEKHWAGSIDRRPEELVRRIEIADRVLVREIARLDVRSRHTEVPASEWRRVIDVYDREVNAVSDRDGRGAHATCGRDAARRTPRGRAREPVGRCRTAGLRTHRMTPDHARAHPRTGWRTL